MCGHLQERDGLKYKGEWIVNAVRECGKKMGRVAM